MHVDPHDRRAGFSLIEVLVALAVLSVFAAALVPNLFQSRRMLVHGNGRVAAHTLLRSLMNAPFDRTIGSARQSEGEADGFRWRIVVRPMVIETPASGSIAAGAAMSSATTGPTYGSYLVTAQVSWGDGNVVTAETVRLARTE